MKSASKEEAREAPLRIQAAGYRAKKKAEIAADPAKNASSNVARKVGNKFILRKGIKNIKVYNKLS